MIKILRYGEIPAEQIFARVLPKTDVAGIVSGIIADVRARGDAALLEYTEKFDKVKLSGLAVTKEEIDEAAASVEPRFIEVMERAAENIRRFHSRQKRSSFIINEEPGIVIGQKIIPVDRAGLYVPGGTAA